MGKTGRDILARLNHDPTLDTVLPSLRQERVRVGQLQRERLRLENSNHPGESITSRLSILEQIAPEWYHRNDIIDIDSDVDVDRTANKKQQPTPVVVIDKIEGDTEKE